MHIVQFAKHSSFLILSGRLTSQKSGIKTDARITNVAFISAFAQYYKIMFPGTFYDLSYTWHCLVSIASVVKWHLLPYET